MTSRNEFSAKVKAAAFLRSDGKCECCTARLYTGKFAFDHVIPDAMGGQPTLENCAVLCTACHGEKTQKRDIPAIAKVKRIKAKHIGAVKRSTWRKPPQRSSTMSERAPLAD